MSDHGEALNLSTDLAGRVLVGPHAGELITRIQNDAGEWQFARGWKHAECLAYRDRSRIRFIVGEENGGASSEADESLTRIAIDLACADRGIDEIPGTLARVGAMTGSSRVCIFTAEDGDAGSWSNSHEWCAAGERPMIHLSQDVAASRLEPITTQFEQKPWNFVGGTVGEDGAAQSWLESRSTLAILSVAVFHNGTLRGFTCYEGIDRDHGDVVEDLRLIAILLMQAVGRSKTESELRKTDELFQLLRNATGDIVFDRDLRFVDGREPSDVVPSDLDDSHGEWRFTGEEWFSIIHPADVDGVRRQVEAILADRERDSFSIEYRARRGDGYIHLLDRGEVIRDDDGKPIRVIGLSTDVSERVIAWQRVRESERRFRAVIENVSEVILVLNGDGFVEYASPSSRPVLGYEPSTLEGTLIFDNVHTEDAEWLRTILSRETEGGDISGMATVRYRHTLGNWILLESTATTLKRDAQMHGSVLVCRDVTKRRRAERQIEQSTRLTSLGHLASSLAHEFNNVLMGARPYVDVIRRTSDPGVVENAVGRIEAAIDRGRSISERIVSFAQPASTVVEAIALGPWIRSVGKDLRELLPPTVALDLEGPEEGIYVSADPVGLHQALVNLVINARDATGGRGRITIEWNGASETKKYSSLALIPADHAVIEIYDTGGAHSGLPDQPTEWSVGTEQAPALGLTVVRQLLSAQGGSVEIDRSDRGTSYFLILRRAQSARTAEASPIAEKPRRRILLVEDDEIVASGISAVLELEGQQVELVSTGRAAIEHIREYGVPDVVILDIGLPDISGVEVFGRLRTRHRHLPVIFSSGHGRRKELEPLLTQPEVAFLQKPYDARTLMETVERIVGVG